MKKLIQLSSLHLFVILLATSCGGTNLELYENEKELIAAINNPDSDKEQLEEASKDVTNTNTFNNALIIAIKNNNLKAVRFLLEKISPEVSENMGEGKIELISGHETYTNLPKIEADTIVIAGNKGTIDMKDAKAGTIFVINNRGDINMQGAQAGSIAIIGNMGPINMQGAKAKNLDMTNNSGGIKGLAAIITNSNESVDSDEF